MSAAISKALRVLFALAGHEVHGMSAGDIAAASGLSAPAATQYRQALEDEGIVEQVAPGRWRLSPRIVQVARDHQGGLDRIKHMVAETEQRYSRSRQ